MNSYLSDRPVYDPPRDRYDHFPDPRVVYIYPTLSMYSITTGKMHNVTIMQDGKFKIEYDVSDNTSDVDEIHQFRLYVNGEDSGRTISVTVPPPTSPFHIDGAILLDGVHFLE